MFIIALGRGVGIAELRLAGSRVVGWRERVPVEGSGLSGWILFFFPSQLADLEVTGEGGEADAVPWSACCPAREDSLLIQPCFGAADCPRIQSFVQPRGKQNWQTGKPVREKGRTSSDQFSRLLILVCTAFLTIDKTHHRSYLEFLFGLWDSVGLDWSGRQSFFPSRDCEVTTL